MARTPPRSASLMISKYPYWVPIKDGKLRTKNNVSKAPLARITPIATVANREKRRNTPAANCRVSSATGPVPINNMSAGKPPAQTAKARRWAIEDRRPATCWSSVTGWLLKGYIISPRPAMTAAQSNARSDVVDFLTVTQAISAGIQAAMAQAISIIEIFPTPVLVRKVAITEASIEKAPTPAAAAAEPTTLSHVATAPAKEETRTVRTTRWRQIAPPAGWTASREYQIKLVDPTTIAAAKVAIALIMAKGSNMTVRPT